ncbi:MAG: AAA family ATPase [candidate division WOR-3 bacterium]
MDIRAELRQLMEERGISLTAISRAIGRSTAAISQYLSGSYAGNISQLEEILQGYITRYKEKLRKPKLCIEFVNTSIARKCFEVARLCHLDGEMGLLYGDAGLGKTMAIKEYAKRNSDVVLIEADLGYTAKIVIAEIYKALGLPGEACGHIHNMMDRIVERLKGSGRLIIIDEAEHLPYKALELIRRIHDKTGVGILLVGMPRLRDNVAGSNYQYKQLYSRIGVSVKLSALRVDDVEQIVQSVLPKANGLCKEFFKYSGANTRTLSKLIARSIRVAEINNIDITADVIRETAKMLIV